ncbi:carbonic anhydrase [Variovorax ureilyticus]|uniref:carbonic anhydrase n=1 Tax=Variovorax ureilyticus TaxID=1836198 RepID=UPI003D678146
MLRLDRLVIAGVIAFGLCAAASATEHAHWSYGSGKGPKEWAALSEENRLCGAGHQQSPIDLQERKASSMADQDAAIHFGKVAGKMVNNGHTLQVDVSDGAQHTIAFKGADYQLAQFHFHTPSEHHFDGKSFPMEMHLVSKDSGGRITVVGVFIKAGKQNEVLAPLFANLPGSEGASHDVEVDLAALMPPSHKAFVYSGSLTTPPCSESVNWVVLEQPIEMSSKQIRAFQKLFRDNHRPVQSINGRKVVEESVDL